LLIRARPDLFRITMSNTALPTSSRVDRAFFACCVGLFLWTMATELASPRPDTRSLLLTGAIALMAGTDLVAAQRVRRLLMLASAVMLAVSFIA